MAKIFLISTAEGERYRVIVRQPGTFVSGQLIEPEKLVIAVFATPGAEMSDLRVLRPEENPEATNDFVQESLLPCDAGSTKALLAAGFEWDDAAGERARQFDIPTEEVNEIQKAIVRLHDEQLTKMMGWMKSRVGLPPAPPWKKG